MMQAAIIIIIRIIKLYDLQEAFNSSCKTPETIVSERTVYMFHDWGGTLI